MKCDLHTHSAYSDGSYSPAEIIREAKKLDLTVALTDHDTVDGLGEFMKEAEIQGVTAVPGIEISTGHEEHELHLIGLFISPEHHKRIESTLKKYRDLKEEKNIELAKRLYNAGYLIDYDSVKKKGKSGNINRVQFALELMEKGYVTSIDEAFKKILSDNGGFYIPPERFKTTDAIIFLKSVGALPVLAHPLKDVDEATLKRILPSLIEAGLIGMETMHSDYDKEKIAVAEKTACEFGLLPSGGSDFHGKRKPEIYLGAGKGNLNIPFEFYENLLKEKNTSK